MYNNPFIHKIKNFYYSHKQLSFLLIFNLLCFILLKEKFYISFFFLFILYFSGSLFTKIINNSHLFATYILGGILGSFLYLLWQKKLLAMPDMYIFSPALQTAIISVLTAITAFAPNNPFRIAIINIKLKYITLILIIVNLLSINEPALYLAHLGSVATGLIYGFILKNKYLFNFKRLTKILKNLRFTKAEMKAEYNPKRPLSDDEYNTIKVEKQKKIDTILDKISKSGYDSLTKEEKDFLFNTSKK